MCGADFVAFDRLGRTLRRHRDRLVYRIGSDGLRAALDRIGLCCGDTICCHAALGELGYFEGGPQAIVKTLMDAVGPTGTILMPSFPMLGSSLSQIESGAVFDVRTTPSKVGILTEVFRRMPGVLRSLHPTNSIAAWGRKAEYYIAGHQDSPTAYGDETPLGRLSRADDGYLLLFNVHPHSILHHLQERVKLPNLFLPKQQRAPFIDHDGRRRETAVTVMRPYVPYFIAIPPKSGTLPDWAVLHDFALIFPRHREALVRRLGYQFEGYPELFERRGRFEAQGILRACKIGRGEIGLLKTRPMFDCLVPELRMLIDRYRDHYSVADIQARRMPNT